MYMTCSVCSLQRIPLDSMRVTAGLCTRPPILLIVESIRDRAGPQRSCDSLTGHVTAYK